MKENEFLKYIYASTPPHASVPIPVGDDMAGVTLPGNNPLALLKIDQVLDRVHVDARIHTPRAIGIKAVNRCLSDCAAMAVLPAAILVSVALPKEADSAFARELFLGCQSAAAVFGVPIVGGDTAIWDQRLAVTIAALGQVATAAPIPRSGAKPGDVIAVSGALGGSILGRHMTFTPRIALAQHLVTHAKINAMMDLSDGLLKDLPRLCEQSNVGAQVDSRLLPVHADAHRLSERDHVPAVQHALSDGEDYELLFTLHETEWQKLADSGSPIPITAIGVIENKTLLHLVAENGERTIWPDGGWEYGVNIPTSG